jgi:hypothetical protein
MINADSTFTILFAVNIVNFVATAYRLWRFHPDAWRSLGGTTFFPSLIGTNFLFRWQFSWFVSFSGQHVELNDPLLSNLVYFGRLAQVLGLATLLISIGILP